MTLGYAGLLPFYGFLAGSWWLRDWPAALSVQGFVIYSLGILCFLGGTLWGRVQRFDEPGTARLIISNGVVLFAVATANNTTPLLMISRAVPGSSKRCTRPHKVPPRKHRMPSE